MNDNRMVKAVRGKKPSGKRNVGKPLKKWKDNIIQEQAKLTKKKNI